MNRIRILISLKIFIRFTGWILNICWKSGDFEMMWLLEELIRVFNLKNKFSLYLDDRILNFIRN